MRRQYDEAIGSNTYAGLVSAISVLLNSNGKEGVEEVQVVEKVVVEINMTFPETENNNGEEVSEVQKQQPGVCKYKNDVYYYNSGLWTLPRKVDKV